MHRFKVVVALTALLTAAGLSAKEVVVAQVAPYSAVESNVGEQLKYGIELYLDEMNSVGGVNGNKIRLATKDRGGDPNSLVTSVRELAQEAHPLAFIGLMGTGSMNTLVQQKVLAQIGIPVIGVRTGAISLRHPLDPLLFHTRASYDIEAERIVTYLATIGYKRLASVTERSAFGSESQGHFAAAVRERSLTMVAELTLPNRSADMAASIAKLLASHPDAVVAAGSSDDIADFYKAFRQRDVSTPVVTLSTVDSGEVVGRIGVPAAHGLGIALVVPDPRNGRSVVVREFRKVEARLRSGRSNVSQPAIEGYIAAKVFVHALQNCGANPSPARLISELENMHSFDAGDFFISFSRTNHSGASYVDVGIIGAAGELLQ